jgi:predicted polyphosphate/ATP-dependent NAD kinase
MGVVGFVVNPIAGMGGKVGLKGTDGTGILEKAIELGAEPVAEKRAYETLKLIFDGKPDIKWLTCSKNMGEEVLRKVGFKEKEDYTVVYDSPSKTSSEDTKNACLKFKDKEVELILFCGGDGTARDIFKVVGKDIPIIGIPAGVKMFSSVFGVNPRSTAEVVLGFLKDEYGLAESEIMDISEEDYRRGELHAELFGYALSPYESTLVQFSKSVFGGVEDEAAKEEIAEYVMEIMKGENDTVFILGAGSTVKKIGEKLNIDKTLLGVDVVKNGELIAKDVNERALLDLLETETKVMIIVGVIGAQGFVFGRGNQQLSPDVLRKVGKENIKIVATPLKLSETPRLMVDTGDLELDNMLSGFYRVIVGYHEMRMVKVEVGGGEKET